MAHFAKIENGIVVGVYVVGDEFQDTYAQWRAEFDETYVQTSFNNRIRGTYAGIGYSYNADEDIFIAPQPYPSWLRVGSFWEAPIPMPSDGMYSWNEETLTWDEIASD